jgi:hypothetical protein
MVLFSVLIVMLAFSSCTEQMECPLGLPDAGPVDVPDTEVPPPDGADVGESTETTPPPEDIPEADATVEPMPGQSDGYVPGGMMARYFAGAAPNADDLPETNFLWRLEPELSLTKTQGDFATLNDGKLFTVHLEGGLYVEETGAYTMMVTVSDSVRVQLHGTTVLEMWKAGEQLTMETTLVLEAGWHPLDIVYARDPYRAHLQVWFAREGELVQPLNPSVLGYSDTLPTDAPDLTADGSIGTTHFYYVPIAVQASVPVKVTGVIDKAGTVTTHEENLYTSVHDFHLPLTPSATTTVTLFVEDPWGRSMTLTTETVETEAIPNYTPGGLLGTYYDGIAFDTETGQRVDAPLNIPYQYSLGVNSDMGMPIGIDYFSARWEGGLLIPTAGTYTLYFGTDDGQRLWVDGELVAEMWVTHAPAYVAATMHLAEGWHLIAAEMFENTGGAQAVLEWEGPDTVRQLIPADFLGFVAPVDNGNIPTVTPSVSSIGPAKNTVHVSWATNKLTTALLEWTTDEGAQTLTTTTIATVGTATLPGMPPGTTPVTITATDTAGLSSEPANLEVTLAAPPADATFLELFDGEEFEPTWMVVTQGENDPTASWVLNDGDVVENGNAYGNGTLGYNTLGTFLWAPDVIFGQGKLMAHIYSGDNDGFGLMWGIQNEETYYRFTVRQEGSFAQLVRVDNGAFTLLYEDPDYMPPLNAWYFIEVHRNGHEHAIVVDGQTIMTVTDPTYWSGSIAIYSWGMTNYRTDFVAITP